MVGFQCSQRHSTARHRALKLEVQQQVPHMPFISFLRTMPATTKILHFSFILHISHDQALS